jgi:hypothetical protein
MSEQGGVPQQPLDQAQQGGAQWTQPDVPGQPQFGGQPDGVAQPVAPAPAPAQVGGPQPQFGQQPMPYPYPQQGGQVPPPGFVGDPMAGAYPAGPYGWAPPKQKNAVALTGAILSIVPPVGLIVSLIGLARSKARGGAGKKAAIWGIALSLVLGCTFGFLLYKVGKSTAADPACISAEQAVTAMTGKMSADESALSAAESSGQSAQVITALNAMVADLQTVKTGLDSDVTNATHANVKAAMQTLDNDLGVIITVVPELESGDASAASSMESVATHIQADGNAVDNLCGNIGNG